jgi:hypothetical protein
VVNAGVMGGSAGVMGGNAWVRGGRPAKFPPGGLGGDGGRVAELAADLI